MITIDLSGPAGNGFALLAQAKTWRAQLATVDRAVEPLSADDLVGKTYSDLLNAFDARFKGVVEYRFLHDPRDKV